MKQIRRRLTYANVMSSLAVFLVVGGATAFAALGKNSVGPKQLKKNAVITSKIKKGAVTGDKLNLATIGTVPNASHADKATSATSADKATSADSAAKATTATTAANAEQLGGLPASSYAKSQLEPIHFLGTAGQPALQNSCKNIGSDFQPAGFYKDPMGVVHLVGDINGCSGETVVVFTLPPGFRPLNFERYISHKGDTTIGTIRVDPDGTVTTFSNATPVLNGMYFRTN